MLGDGRQPPPSSTPSGFVGPIVSWPAWRYGVGVAATAPAFATTALAAGCSGEE